MTESHIYTDRVRVSLLKKVNPIWWFMNDSEQTLDQAPDYHPEWPYWRRWVTWNVIRNPLQNFRAFVIGVQDRNYTVTGKPPVLTVQRNDLMPPETGYQWCWLHGGELWLPRAFVSYAGTKMLWYLGWQPTGFFGVKLVIR